MPRVRRFASLHERKPALHAGLQAPAPFHEPGVQDMNDSSLRSRLHLLIGRRDRIEWTVLALVVTLATLLCAYAVLNERQLIRTAEIDRLSARARVVDDSIQRRLQSTRHVLQQVRDTWQTGDNATTTRLMTAFTHVTHGVDALQVVDRDANPVLASGRRSELLPTDMAYRNSLARMNDSATLYVSQPRERPTGQSEIRLTLPIASPRGSPTHFVTAVLSSDYFDIVMRSVLQTDDTWSGLTLQGGEPLTFVASDLALESRVWPWLNALFHTHLSGSTGVSMRDDTQGPDHSRRLVVLHTINTQALAMDKHFALAFSRDLAVMDQDWLSLARRYSLWLVALAGAGALALHAVQRQRKAWAALVQQQDQERAEHAARMQLALASANLGLWELHVPDGFMVVDTRSAAMQGREPSDPQVSSAHWLEDIHPDDRSTVEQQLIAHLRGELSALEVEYRLHHRDGHWVWVQCRGRVVERDPLGQPLRMLGTRMDISARKRHESEIERLAFYDSLTGLPNRRLLQDRLHRSVAASARLGQFGAVMFMDLDNFKNLNDTLGHDVGDQLLTQVATRLGQVTRATDTVARLGGDEFVVLLDHLGATRAEARAHLEAIGRTMLRRLARPYDLNGQTIHSTPSIGVALFEGADNRPEDLLKQADMAMYHAKSAGRNTLRFFEPEIQTAITETVQLQADLRLALQRAELLLHYQPIHDRRGSIVGVEALVRWRHPTLGMVSPGRFIPVAEQCGLIVPLGDWVLESACRRLASWTAQPATAHLSVAVNISARQLRQQGFVNQVLETLKRTGAPPARLKLELTESMFLLDAEDIVAKMVALKSYGIGFSLDDFGTGYSSLAYLQRLPLDQLKIDQTFVRELATDNNGHGATIACAIIGLAHNLGLQVIAEGVETDEQLAFLLGNHCDAFQGYLFGRPGPSSDIEYRLDLPAASRGEALPEHPTVS